MRKSVKVTIIISIFIAAVTIAFSFDPYPQPVDYHLFADTAEVIGIPNFRDVASNIFFIAAGVFGLIMTVKQGAKTFLINHRMESIPFTLTFVSTILVGFGSSYYHLSPDNYTLLWDRLPMAAGFMSLLSIVISERISLRGGFYLLPPLVLIGIGSVIYWHITESRGAGDLRPYILVQFFTIIIIPAILCIFRPRYTGSLSLAGMIVLYGCAKFFEVYDVEVFNSTGGHISGHTIKHIFSAAALYILVLYLKNRVLRKDTQIITNIL